ncbi:protein kinase, putative [Bodo saltans]|uniref:Protein kinase, putative n=1 Tax=Bodo saltans TaxID=75058 RepID=A0A0S4JJN6_BODSA|nr:protein kinase, putative [Bodo saltans]|eukprot:CUG91698.1 protein kinase, putative [Bodo saltans]
MSNNPTLHDRGQLLLSTTTSTSTTTTTNTTVSIHSSSASTTGGASSVGGSSGSVQKPLQAGVPSHDGGPSLLSNSSKALKRQDSITSTTNNNKGISMDRSSSFHSSTSSCVTPSSVSGSTVARRAMETFTNSFFSSSGSSSALKALQQCVSSTPKPPSQTHIQTLVDVSRRQHDQTTVADSLMGQNTWLVAQLQKQLKTAPEEHVIAKVMMVTHDVLAFGAPEFAHALAPVAESYFDPDSLIAHVPHRTAMYDHTTRFFISYVHSLLQFQLRHRSEQNLLDPETTDGLLKVPEDETVAFWTPHMRDLVLSCLTLAKFVLAANVSSPPTDKYCFVFAEIVKRYIGATRQLYRVSTGALSHRIKELRLSAQTSSDEMKRNHQCVREYIRLTERLNEFYDSIRALPKYALHNEDDEAQQMNKAAQAAAASSPSSNTFDIARFLNSAVVPDKLSSYSLQIDQFLKVQLKQLQELEQVSPDRLEDVLALSSPSPPALSPQPQPPPPAAISNNSFQDTELTLNSNTNNSASTPSVTIPPSEGATTSDDASTSASTAVMMMNDMIRGHVLAGTTPQAHHRDPQPSEHTDDTHNGSLHLGVTTTSPATSPVPSQLSQQQQRSDGGSLQTSLMYTAEGKVGKKKGGGGGSLDDAVNDIEQSICGGANSSTTPETMEQLASRFRVLDQVLGKGGFGVVYKAWDEEEGKHVACKEVKLIADNKAALQELYQEYSVLATLKHANVVKVLGFVVHQGHGRIFMEWVPSGSVQSVLQETKKGLREPIVRRYIREALQGLAYLHSRGIVHRDVKPGNMLLNGDGSVKLTDFGTSRTHDGAANTMQTGTVVGTVPYLAPECVRGTYSAASDVWAMGCTALHMITGKAPWANEARDNIGLIFILGNLSQQKQTQLPKLVKEHEMSEGLRSFITSAMTLDRHQRPTADMLLRDAFVTGEM